MTNLNHQYASRRVVIFTSSMPWACRILDSAKAGNRL
jgi:hypothetical protein